MLIPYLLSSLLEYPYRGMSLELFTAKLTARHEQKQLVPNALLEKSKRGSDIGTSEEYINDRRWVTVIQNVIVYTAVMDTLLVVFRRRILKGEVCKAPMGIAAR